MLWGYGMWSLRSERGAVAVVLRASDRHLLLVRRADIGIWILPGGGIEEGEEAATAALREVAEETGLAVHLERQVAAYRAVNWLATDIDLFLCHTAEGEASPGEECSAAAFFPLDRLPELFPPHTLWLADALRGEEELIVGPVPGVTYGRFFSYLLRHPWHILRVLWTLLFRR